MTSSNLFGSSPARLQIDRIQSATSVRKYPDDTVSKSINETYWSPKDGVDFKISVKIEVEEDDTSNLNYVFELNENSAQIIDITSDEDLSEYLKNVLKVRDKLNIPK